MVNISNLPPTTLEIVWALLQEVAQSQKENIPNAIAVG